MENLYDVLEGSKKAAKEIIEKAYKTLAKKYHPDLQESSNKAYAEEKMKKINEAYEILSDEFKRSEYDKELEELEQQKVEAKREENKTTNNYYTDYQTNNQNYSNQNYYNNQNTNYCNEEENWRNQFLRLSKKEQKKVIKKIEKNANEEYRKLYEDYFRSLGYKIPHKWTLKDFVTIAIVIIVLIVIFLILWIIPSTHAWMINLYEENLVVNILVKLVIGIYNGIITFFQNITSIKTV